MAIILSFLSLLMAFASFSVLAIGCPNIGAGNPVPVGTMATFDVGMVQCVASCSGSCESNLEGTLPQNFLGWSIFSLDINNPSAGSNGSIRESLAYSAGTDLKILTTIDVDAAFEKVNRQLANLKSSTSKSAKADLSGYIKERRSYYSSIASNAVTNRDAYRVVGSAFGQGETCILGVCNCHGRGRIDATVRLNLVCLGTGTSQSVYDEVMKDIFTKFPKLRKR